MTSRFAKWAFRLAGTLGILQIVPLYFYETQIAIDMPPALTHVEYYYGFIGVTLAWQIVFLVISSDPLRFQPLMLAAILEKAGFVLPCLWLFLQGRLPNMILAAALLDWLYGMGFVVAYLTTRPAAHTASGGLKPVYGDNESANKHIIKG